MIQVTGPFEQFFDAAGDPLDGGYIYIGQSGLDPETYPVDVSFDLAGLIPAAQPLRTASGYIQNTGAPAQVFAIGNSYSITVRNRAGELVYTMLTAGGALATIQQFIDRVEAGAAKQFNVMSYAADDVIADVVAGTRLLSIHTALGLALDAVQAAGGGTLVWPPGKYLMTARVSKSLTVPLVIRGGGMCSTQVYVDNTDGGISLDYSGDADKADGVFLDGMSFYAARASAGTAFKMVETSGGNRHERMFTCRNTQFLSEDIAIDYFTKFVDLLYIWRPHFENVLATGPYMSVTDVYATTVGISTDECYSPSFSQTHVWNCVTGISNVSTSSPGPEGFWMLNGSKVVECHTPIRIKSAAKEPSVTISDSHVNGRDCCIDIESMKLVRINGCLFYAGSAAAVLLKVTDVDSFVSTHNQFHFPSLEVNTNIGISFLGACDNVISAFDTFSRMTSAAVRVSLGTTRAKVLFPTLTSTPIAVDDLSNAAILVNENGLTNFGDGDLSGPDHVIFRDSASPATNDVIGRNVFAGKSSTGAVVEYGASRSQIIDATNGSEDGSFQVFSMIAGTLTRIADFRNGVLIGLPTGNGLGAGTINLAGASGLFVGLNGGPGVYSGAGTPEGVVTAAIGSTYHRTDGGAGTSFYVKQSGTGNTGWAGK
jgi:hypothetical protein